MGSGEEPYRRRRCHEPGHAYVINILRSNTRILEERFQSAVRKTALVFTTGITFFIGCEQNRFAVTQGNTGIKQIFIYTEPDGHGFSVKLLI
jgi:hypothetical protein